MNVKEEVGVGLLVKKKKKKELDFCEIGNVRYLLSSGPLGTLFMPSAKMLSISMAQAWPKQNC